MDNPVQDIKQKEEEAQKVVAGAQEKAKKDLAEIVKQKENELKQKTEDAQKKVEEDLCGTQREVDKQIIEAQTKVATNAEEIRNKSQDKVAKAANVVIKELINS